MITVPFHCYNREVQIQQPKYYKYFVASVCHCSSPQTNMCFVVGNLLPEIGPLVSYILCLVVVVYTCTFAQVLLLLVVIGCVWCGK